MVLWLVFAAMTALAVLAVMVPLSRARPSGAGEPANVAVYRDQLRAVEADAARGLIRPDEADAARTEISRRLLAAAGTSATSGDVSSTAARGRTAIVLGSFVIALALGGYLARGSPDLPGQPLSERRDRDLAAQDVDTLVARVEGHLQENPSDARGWQVIAPVYLRLGRFADAARAYAATIRIAGATAERQAGLGEALTREADGMVTAEARAAFEKSAELDASLVRPQFFLGLARAQDGDTDAAVAVWRGLLADTPPDAPWRDMVERQIAAVEGSPGEPAGTSAAQSQMIEQMVAGLAERLREDGGDLEGWLRLMRSYTVMRRDEEARTALADARRTFAGDEAALQRIDEAAKEFGIKEMRQ